MIQAKQELDRDDEKPHAGQREGEANQHGNLALGRRHQREKPAHDTGDHRNRQPEQQEPAPAALREHADEQQQDADCARVDYRVENLRHARDHRKQEHRKHDELAAEHEIAPGQLFTHQDICEHRGKQRDQEQQRDKRRNIAPVDVLVQMLHVRGIRAKRLLFLRLVGVDDLRAAERATGFTLLQLYAAVDAITHDLFPPQWIANWFDAPQETPRLFPLIAFDLDRNAELDEAGKELPLQPGL